MNDSTPDSRQHASKQSTLVSVLVNVVLSCLQLAIGLFAQSAALIADAIHSFSDLVSDAVVLVANQHSSKAPDHDHPYGHLRFETAATLAIGAILIAVGLGMVWGAAQRLWANPAGSTVHLIALPMALLALVAKEGLFRYLLRVAKRVNSTMLVANAWHARSDAASSLVVAVGIGANLLGFGFADALAALLVGLMIVRMGWRFSIGAFHDLTDRAVEPDVEQAIFDTILATPGVLGAHDLKTRRLGDMIWVEVDIEMDGQLTIEAGHDIAVEARERVMNAFPVLDVMTHFDPVHVPDASTPYPLSGETPYRRESP